MSSDSRDTLASQALMLLTLFLFLVSFMEDQLEKPAGVGWVLWIFLCTQAERQRVPSWHVNNYHWAEAPAPAKSSMKRQHLPFRS